MVEIGPLLSAAKDDSGAVLSADFSNKVLRLLELPEKQLRVRPKALAELISIILSDSVKNDALQVALFTRYSSRWLPPLVSFPKRMRSIVDSAVKMLCEHEGDVAVAAGIFLATVASSYPKKAKACFALLLKSFRRLASVDSQQPIQRSQAIAAVIFEIAKKHQELLHQGTLLGLRLSVLRVKRSLKAQNSIVSIRALFRELLLWADYLLMHKPKQGVVRTAIVPLMLKIHEYLEAVLSVSEFAPMFIDLRRVTVTLAKEYGAYYPTRRTAAKLLLGLQNATVADQTASGRANLDVRLSKLQRHSSQIARILRDKLMKSLQPEPNPISSACLSAATLDGLVWRDAGVWKSMHEKFSAAAKKAVDEQVSPAAMIMKGK